jgi:L-threonylcarbamoyladenylate synthase
VRVSSHPGVPGLLEAAGGPITSTSANRPGAPPARDAADAAETAAGVAEAGGRVLVLDGGRLHGAQPSTIVRCGATVRLLREGAISRTDLESVVDLE